jgi:cell division septation protein DedD
MKTRDFREIQVSSSILVLIFLAVIALGVFIFLLGVNVGKKQVQMAAAQTVAEKVAPAEPVAAPGEVKTSVTEGGTESLRSRTPATAEKIEPALKQETPPVVDIRPPESKPASKPSSLPAAEKGFFVQVGALDDPQAAKTLADEFRKQGYRSLVLDPIPTDRKPVYRVRIGSYASRAQAKAALDKLNKAAGAGKRTGYYVVKV